MDRMLWGRMARLGLVSLMFAIRLVGTWGVVWRVVWSANGSNFVQMVARLCSINR